jgi:predicted outer membrane protein
MKTRYLTATILASLTLAAAHAAQAQTAPAAPPTAAAAKLDSADRDFLENAAQAGHLEVAGSKLALEKARDPDVKAFAQKMIDDHGKAGQQLATLAQGKGYQAPTEPSLVQQAKLKALGLRRQLRQGLCGRDWRIRAPGRGEALRESLERREGSRRQAIRDRDPAGAATTPGNGDSHAATPGCRQEIGVFPEIWIPAKEQMRIPAGASATSALAAEHAYGSRGTIGTNDRHASGRPGLP